MKRNSEDRVVVGASGRRNECTNGQSTLSPRRPVSPSPRLPVFLLSLACIVFLLPFAFAQSGRQQQPPPKPQPPPQQGKRPVTPPANENRPRRAADEAQDDKPLKLKADLVTVITSVFDAA